MVALQALYNALPMGAFMALMTALSGWLYGMWGANIFWLMAAMGIPALLMKVEPKARRQFAQAGEAADNQ